MKSSSLYLALSAGLVFVGCSKDATDDATDSGITADSGMTTDSGITTDSGDTEEPTLQSTAVVTTVASDYSTGSIAAVDMDAWTASDELFVTSSDPSVVAEDGWVFQINRYGHDSVRKYSAGDWAAPLWEQSMGEYSNPQDVEICNGDLFVSLYGANHMAVVDLETGVSKGQVDLSAFADTDGVSPEAASIVEVDGKLYVGLQQMDTTQTYWASEGGKVVEVDCASMAVTQSWNVGGNTNLMAWPDSGKVIAGAEAFGDDTAGLYVIDTVAGTKTQLVDSASLGVNILDVAVVGDKAMAVSVKADWSAYVLSCMDLSTGTILSSVETDSYLTSISANNRGEAYVTAGSSWIDPSAPSGLAVYDVESCTAKGDWMSFSMYPTSVAFY
jgi:hypothetical protein